MKWIAAALVFTAGAAWAQSGPVVNDDFGRTEGSTSVGTQVSPTGEVGTHDDELGAADGSMVPVSPAVPDLESPATGTAEPTADHPGNPDVVPQDATALPPANR